MQTAQAELGFFSPLTARWEQQRLARGDARHHLAVDVEVEDAFWCFLLAGAGLDTARRRAGVGRSTAYRWWQARFWRLREQGVTVRAAARELRVSPCRAREWENERRRASEQTRRHSERLERRAVRDSARVAEELARGRAPRSDVERRDAQYWQLMRCGLTNTAACTILGVTRRTGGRIRARHRQQTAAPVEIAE